MRLPLVEDATGAGRADARRTGEGQLPRDRRRAPVAGEPLMAPTAAKTLIDVDMEALAPFPDASRPPTIRPPPRSGWGLGGSATKSVGACPECLLLAIRRPVGRLAYAPLVPKYPPTHRFAGCAHALGARVYCLAGGSGARSTMVRGLIWRIPPEYAESRSRARRTAGYANRLVTSTRECYG